MKNTMSKMLLVFCVGVASIHCGSGSGDQAADFNNNAGPVTLAQARRMVQIIDSFGESTTDTNSNVSALVKPLVKNTVHTGSETQTCAEGLASIPSVVNASGSISVNASFDDQKNSLDSAIRYNKCSATYEHEINDDLCQYQITVDGTLNFKITIDEKTDMATLQVKTSQPCSGLSVKLNNNSYTVGYNHFYQGNVYDEVDASKIIGGLCVNGTVFTMQDLYDSPLHDDDELCHSI